MAPQRQTGKGHHRPRFRSWPHDVAALNLVLAMHFASVRGREKDTKEADGDGEAQCESGTAADHSSCAASAEDGGEQNSWLLRHGRLTASVLRRKPGLVWGKVRWGETDVCTDTLRLGALFAVRGLAGKHIFSNNCTLIDEPVQLSSSELSAAFSCTKKGLRVEWSARLYSLDRSLGEALRVTFRLQGVPVQSLAALLVPQRRCLKLAEAGSVDGSPVRVGNGRFFLAAEHPLAKNQFREKGQTALWGRAPQHALVAEIGHLSAIDQSQLSNRSSYLGPTSLIYGAVIVAVAEPQSQGRRAFAEYLRTAQPQNVWQGPLVHYNSWYDFYQPLDGLGYSRGHVAPDHHALLLKDKFVERGALKRVAAFRNLTKRGVKLDSFLWDDGWDDPEALWEFDWKRFPNGFSKIAEKASQYLGAGLGVWLSPWGGYGETKEKRLKLGRQQGFETNANGFSLAGPKYAARFASAVQRFRQESRVNMFKFDGVAGDPAELSAEVEAMLGIIASIRTDGCKDDAANKTAGEKCESVWINLTTGTWPSPFFILWADSIWRGGMDIEKSKSNLLEGLSERQKWQIYRECQVYDNIVKKADLFPLSRLMIHGVVLGTHGDAMYMGLNRLTPADSVDWAQEVWSHAAMGMQLQELYVSPQLMEDWSWNELSSALRWSRKYSQVLEDAHWAIPADCAGMRAANTDVHCGGHRASDCAACPQGNGATWCNGDCKWDATSSTCVPVGTKASTAFRPYGIASWRSETHGGHGLGFIFLRNPMLKKQRTRTFRLAKVLEIPEESAAKPLALRIVRRLAPSVDPKRALQCDKLKANSTEIAKGTCKVAGDAALQLSMLPGEVLVLSARSMPADEAAATSAKSDWEPAIPVYQRAPA